jgi:DNA-binding transcriptional MerR regulator
MATRLKQTFLNFDFPETETNTPAPEKVPDQSAPPISTTTPVATPVSTMVEEPVEVDFTAGKKKSKPVAERKSTRGRMKISDMAAGLDKLDIPDDEELFSKRYYPIGMVTKMFNVNHSLLRFWEAEFDILKPRKNGKGDRLFRPEDVKNLKIIYHLLRERKYTIEGAKDYLKKSKAAEKRFELIESLKDLKGFLFELKASL